MAKAARSLKKIPAKAESSSSEESSSDSSEATSPPVKKSAPTTVKKRADPSDDSSDTSSSTVSVKATPVAAVKGTEDSSDSSTSSHEESSSDDDDSSADETTSAPAKVSAANAQKTSDPSDTSGSDESSSDSDGDSKEEESPPAQIPLAEAKKKRKADGETDAPPKKAKLANGSASVEAPDEEIKSIFVGRLSWNVDNDWLAEEFAECGEVESARVQMDRNTGRSRGFGYVNFKTTDAVEKALALNGKEIDGRAINVDKSSFPDKKASADKRAQAFGDTRSPASAVLFVGNLSFGVNEDTLWETFGEYGDVKSVRIPTDRETGKPKGFGYVEYSEVGAAKKAHGELQGYELGGRTLRLDFSQPRDSAGGRGGGQASRGSRGSWGRGGGFSSGGFSSGGFSGARGRGFGRGGRGGDRGGRGRGRGARTGGITQFEGHKVTFD